MAADDPHQKIELKAFHCQVLNNHEALKKEQEGDKALPIVQNLDNSIVQKNYLQIKQDVQDIINLEMERMLNEPALSYLIIKKV